MEIQRYPTKRKRPGRIDEKMVDKMSISGRIFHQIMVIFFWFSHEFKASFSPKCCHILNASGHRNESVSPCNILQFTLHPILTLAAKYFPTMP